MSEAVTRLSGGAPAARRVCHDILITYAIVNFLKRREGVDTFDRSTNFNPFRRPLDEPGLE